MKTLLLLFSLSICILSFGQCDKDLKMFKHYSIKLDNDTIRYHTYAKKSIDSLKSILIYIQGSKAYSLYQGIPFCTKLDEDILIPQSYYKNQTLDYRTFQVNQVIKDLTKKHKNRFKKIIALGHSEGSDVIAKLGTINTSITHFGYLSGGGNTQFIDFITFIRKEVDQGILSEAEAQKQIDTVFNDLKDIMRNPDATDKFWAGKTNSYKRWSHFAEPPIDNLLQIEKPIFAAIGTKDKSVAVESAYLIPIEFIRHRKSNLTFKTYPFLDHGFGKELEDGSFEDHWQDVFRDFLNWVNAN